MLSALIGSISFAGSMVAFAKLQELVSGQPITFPGQQIVNGLLFVCAVALGIWAMAAVNFWGLAAMIVVAALFGVMFVLPIGGADMPVVISLLNAFTGLAAAATGFVLHSNVLIVSGMLVGASGTLLTMMMGKRDEPLDRERPLRRVRQGRRRAGRRARPARTAASCARRPRTTSR